MDFGAVIVKEEDKHLYQPDDSKPKFLIIGFPKCGQMSLHKYLVEMFGKGNVDKYELIWRKDGEEYLKNHWNLNEWRIVIITRNPIQRIWSSYHYFGYNQQMSFEDYLDFEGYSEMFGELNPIKQSNYDYWIKPYLKYNPIIYRMEVLKSMPNFPHKNETNSFDKKGGKWEKFNIPEIPKDLRELTSKRLQGEIDNIS